MRKIKKIITVITAVLLFVFMETYAFSYDRTAHGWYCMRNGKEAPVLESQFKFIEEYDGYYLDKNARDDDKVIYLTFDAGYENGNVEKVLDTLKKHNATGAFFILDNLIKKEPELVCRMAKEGNLVCNHTASHRDMTKITSKEEFARELYGIEEVYKNATGCEMPKFYRPPEGKFSEENMKFAQELGYKTVFWSLAYADWDNANQPDCERSKQLILDNTHNGMVLLLHPTSATNAAILDSLMTEWENMGYRFGTLEELCN